MVSFIVLSQLGVDIAPLLAGAGIIGIAIGLGSQQLVRDIINGLFILVENTVTVGDWVDVGGGHAGRVEELSIRSMTLRDGSGALHTVPFSAVAAVVNTNRGIGNAAIGVTVALGQDIDRAERLLGEIAADMRKEPQYKFVMLSELQYWGVDKVDGSSVTLVGQIVCTDGGRWPCSANSTAAWRSVSRRRASRSRRRHKPWSCRNRALTGAPISRRSRRSARLANVVSPRVPRWPFFRGKRYRVRAIVGARGRARSRRAPPPPDPFADVPRARPSCGKARAACA